MTCPDHIGKGLAEVLATAEKVAGRGWSTVPAETPEQSAASRVADDVARMVARGLEQCASVQHATDFLAGGRLVLVLHGLRLDHRGGPVEA